MSLDQSVAAVRAYVDALNAGDVAALDAIAAEDFVIHQPAGDRRGKGALRAFVAAVRRLLPDVEARIETVVADDAFADGHRVGIVLAYTGTNQKLGRKVSVRELQLYRVVDGKLVERWYAADRAATR